MFSGNQKRDARHRVKNRKDFRTSWRVERRLKEWGFKMILFLVFNGEMLAVRLKGQKKIEFHIRKLYVLVREPSDVHQEVRIQNLKLVLVSCPGKVRNKTGASISLKHTHF